MTMSKESGAYKDISRCLSELVGGIVLIVDPSIGSQSSLPGWAIYEDAVLVNSGIIPVPIHKTVAQRLAYLSQAITKLVEDIGDVGVLVYEKVPVSAHGGRSQAGHASLLMATGAILAGADRVPHYVAIAPISWKKAARPTYVKSDENDAIEMGWVVIEQAKQMLAEGARKLANPLVKRRKKAV